MSELYTEVFDEDSKLYPVVNLKPTTKVPQLWQLSVPGNDNLVARMVSYMSEGDALKQVKQGDKYAHVILMSLSKNGTPAELKGGLGSDPIGAMNTLFNTVYSVVKKLHMDAIMFRFPAKKMVGQERAIQRVIKRLCMSATGGKFVPLDALFQFTGKHAYILIYRKTKPLDSIAGIPGINAELYTKIDSDVGPVYVNKKSGDKVPKDEAIAGSIAAVETPRSDRLVINKTKLSRRALAQVQTVAQDDYVYPNSADFAETSAELSKPATASGFTPQEKAAYDASVTGKVIADRVATTSLSVAERYLPEFNPYLKPEEIDKEIFGQYRKIVESGKSINSIEAVKALTRGLYEVINKSKSKFISDKMGELKSEPGGITKDVTTLHNEAETYYRRRASATIMSTVREFVDRMSVPTIEWYRNVEIPMTNANRGAIREYTSSSYDPINSYLLGRSLQGEDEAEVEGMIKGLDKAFKEASIKLPEGTPVYRGQKLRRPFFEKLVKTRMYMFRNFVSTSLLPIMLGGWTANSSLAMAGAEDVTAANDRVADEPSFKDYTNATNALGDAASAEYIDKLKYEERIYAGWIIHGADKINVIIPGKYGAHPNECEVILPRGLVLSIDNITVATSQADANSRQRLFESTVMTTEQLGESIVYDGDHLLETGEHTPVTGDEETSVGFASFTQKQRVDVMGLLAGVMDIDAMPQRFVL